MRDKTESIRKTIIAGNQLATAILGENESLKQIKEKYPDACDTKELQEKYSVTGFLSPFVSVTRKTDGVKGSMQFLHKPRIYYGFSAS